MQFFYNDILLKMNNKIEIFGVGYRLYIIFIIKNKCNYSHKKKNLLKLFCYSSEGIEKYENF